MQFSRDCQAYFPRNAVYPGTEVGIEIECEGRNLPQDCPPAWSPHIDGSLRGEAMEYVLKQPLVRDKAFKALADLDKCFKNNGTLLNDSQRTSVHVHVNTYGLTLTQVFNFMCLYFIFEDLLVEYAGPKRMGNLFCLRCTDADYLIDQIVEALKQGDMRNFAGDNLRYSSMNITALHKYGSLEFRAFRGTDKMKDIEEWVNLLLAIRDSSKDYQNPREICQQFSVLGPERFLRAVFGGLSDSLMGFKKVSERMYSGVRMAQEIAFATNWVDDEKKPPKAKPIKANPFEEMPRAPRWAADPVVVDDDDDDDDIYVEEEEDDDL